MGMMGKKSEGELSWRRMCRMDEWMDVDGGGVRWMRIMLTVCHSS